MVSGFNFGLKGNDGACIGSAGQVNWFPLVGFNRKCLNKGIEAYTTAGFRDLGSEHQGGHLQHNHNCTDHREATIVASSAS